MRSKLTLEQIQNWLTTRESKEEQYFNMAGGVIFALGVYLILDRWSWLIWLTGGVWVYIIGYSLKLIRNRGRN